MGFRIVEIGLESHPSATALEFIDQVAEFAEAHGADAFSSPPESYPGVWGLEFQGNSSFLNDLTPYLLESIAQIAVDIDPNSPELRSLAKQVGRQLEHQLVDWHGTDGITSARAGRELMERIDGEGSFGFIEAELDLHERRLRKELSDYASAAGPTAWRRRRDLELTIRVDAIALAGAARRLRRIASDLRGRMPGSHLDAAIAAFDRAVPALVDLRDIAEHIDEYSVGHGRIDKVELEPGEVFEMEVGEAEITISARGRTLEIFHLRSKCDSLTACLKHATDHHFVRLVLPGLADFDFVTQSDDGVRIIPRDEETTHQAEVRATLANLNPTAPALEARCDQCGAWL